MAMITGVEVSGFKAHRRLAIKKIPRVALLIGENNAGKSSILHALALPKYRLRDDAIPIGQLADVLQVDSNEAVARIWYESASAPFKVRLQRPDKTEFSWEGGGPAEGDPSKEVFFLSHLRTIPRRFEQRELDFSWGAGPTGDFTGPSLFWLRNNDEAVYGKIQDRMKSMGMGFDLVGSRVLPPNQGELRPTTLGASANITMHGSGVSALLPIVTQAHMMRRRETLLVEEPEAHLYRGSIGKLYQLFGWMANQGLQVICSTHSVDLMFQMKYAVKQHLIPGDSAIFRLERKPGEETQVTRESPEQLGQLKDLIDQDLVAPAEPAATASNGQ